MAEPRRNPLEAGLADRPIGRNNASSGALSPRKQSDSVLDHKTIRATIDGPVPLLCTRNDELDRFRTGGKENDGQKKPGSTTSPETPSQRIKLEENIGCYSS